MNVSPLYICLTLLFEIIIRPPSLQVEQDWSYSTKHSRVLSMPVSAHCFVTQPTILISVLQRAQSLCIPRENLMDRLVGKGDLVRQWRSMLLAQAAQRGLAQEGLGIISTLKAACTIVPWREMSCHGHCCVVTAWRLSPCSVTLRGGVDLLTKYVSIARSSTVRHCRSR